MKWRWHFTIGLIVLGTLWYLIADIKSWMIYIASVFVIVPDFDQRGNDNYHRNFLAHSIIVPLAFLIWVHFTIEIYYITLLFAMITLGVGIHLVCDITIYPSKWKGTYCIKLFTNSFFWFLKKKRGLASTLWLLINFLISVGVLIWVLL